MAAISSIVRTKANTTFLPWLALYKKECEKLGIAVTSEDDARCAYDVGESPETAAAYIAGCPEIDDGEA